jgi:hypothetical protein
MALVKARIPEQDRGERIKDRGKQRRAEAS